MLRGRPIAFASDAMVELPLARTLKKAGARITFVSTPNVYKKFHARETTALGDTPIYERPDRFETFARLADDRPDCVVANLNIANALEGMGFAVKWSTELTFTPIHGFSGAPGLFAMFTGVMHRHDALARVRERDGAPSPPIDLGFFRPVHA